MNEEAINWFLRELFVTAKFDVIEAVGPNGRRVFPPNTQAMAIDRKMTEMLESLRTSERYWLLILSHAARTSDGLAMMESLQYLKSDEARTEGIRIMQGSNNRHALMQTDRGQNHFNGIVASILRQWQPLSPSVEIAMRLWVIEWNDPATSRDFDAFTTQRGGPPLPTNRVWRNEMRGNEMRREGK